MKFAIFAFFVAFCAVAGTAKAHVDVQPEELPLNEFVPNGLVGESENDESLAFLNNFLWTLRGALRTLKGLNCTIKAVINIKYAAQQFINDVTACGAEVTQQLQTLINSCNKVISSCNAILSLNTSSCHNGNTDETSNKKTPVLCFLRLLRNVWSLKHELQRTVRMTKRVPTVGVNGGQCVSAAITELTSAFTMFPSYVKVCSRLTS